QIKTVRKPCPKKTRREAFWMQFRSCSNAKLEPTALINHSQRPVSKGLSLAHAAPAKVPCTVHVHELLLGQQSKCHSRGNQGQKEHGKNRPPISWGPSLNIIVNALQKA